MIPILCIIAFLVILLALCLCRIWWDGVEYRELQERTADAERRAAEYLELVKQYSAEAGERTERQVDLWELREQRIRH